MKKPKCKYCGAETHYSYACWRKPRTNNASKTSSKPSKVKKTTNISSKKTNTRQNAIKRLDDITSKYVRIKYSNQNGVATCYTCGKRASWKDMDCGHWIKRRFLNTRWEIDNLRCQCRNCNRNLQGNYDIYNKKMLAELGVAGCQKLVKLANSNKKITTYEIDRLIEERKLLLEILITQKK